MATRRLSSSASPQSKWGTHDGGGCWIHASFKYLSKCFKSWTFLNATPYHHCKPAPCRQNPAHFAQSGRPVSEELKSKLAVRDVERAVRKRQLLGTCFLPMHRRRGVCGPKRSRNVQHTGVEIDTGDCSAWSHPCRGDARHYSSAASDVDHTVALLEIDKFYQYWSPRPKNSRDQLPFVHLGSAAGDLPLFLLNSSDDRHRTCS